MQVGEQRQPERLRRLLDELRQAKLDLYEAERESELLRQRLAKAEETNQTLTEQLRHWQQQSSRWRKRLQQTELLLKRVVKQYRELSQRSIQA